MLLTLRARHVKHPKIVNTDTLLLRCNSPVLVRFPFTRRFAFDGPAAVGVAGELLIALDDMDG